MRLRVGSLTPGMSRSARETVAVETPASRATSAMLICCCPGMVNHCSRGYANASIVACAADKPLIRNKSRLERHLCNVSVMAV